MAASPVLPNLAAAGAGAGAGAGADAGAGANTGAGTGAGTCAGSGAAPAARTASAHCRYSPCRGRRSCRLYSCRHSPQPTGPLDHCSAAVVTPVRQGPQTVPTRPEEPQGRAAGQGKGSGRPPPSR